MAVVVPLAEWEALQEKLDRLTPVEAAAADDAWQDYLAGQTKPLAQANGERSADAREARSGLAVEIMTRSRRGGQIGQTGTGEYLRHLRKIAGPSLCVGFSIAAGHNILALGSAPAHPWDGPRRKSYGYS